MQNDINTPNNVCQDESTPYDKLNPVKFTIFTANTTLGKEYSAVNGNIQKKSNATMNSGSSETVRMTLKELGERIPNLQTNQALGLGILKDDLKHTAHNLKTRNEALNDPTSHARTKESYQFRAQPSLMLFDYDGNNLSNITAVIHKFLTLMPELKGCEILGFGSSSNGIFLIDAPNIKTNSKGVHLYISVSNGTAIPDINKLLRYRSWKMKECSFKEGKAAWLENTLFDHAVATPERLIFESKPILGTGIATEKREMQYISGGTLDVKSLCFVTKEQEQELNAIIEKTRAAAKGETIKKLRETGHSDVEIKKIVHDMEHRILPHTAQLQGRKSGVVIVSDIIAAIHAGTGQKFIDDDWLDIDGHTPIFGRTKLYVNNDNSIVLHSFKNGGTSYTLLGDTSKLDESDFLNNTAAEPTQESTAEPDFWHYGNHNANNATEPQTKIKTLKDYAINGNSNAMEKELVNQTFILDGIAIAGHLTVIYAKPNTGKTLLVIKMLIDSIEAGRIQPDNVIYINADDNAHGLVTKLKLAEKHGFLMLSPGENGFKTQDFLLHIQNLIATNQARGTVIVLDTLKKFTDLMDKKVGSKFMDIAREFSLKGGSMILLAHTNKNRNKDGKAVFGGTSDIVDDCDGAFILDEVTKTENIKTVLFEKIKARGTVEEEITFSYSVKPTEYPALIESITRGNAAEASQAKLFINKLSDKPAIEAVLNCLANGTHKRTDILYMKHENVSRRIVEKCLDDYTGDLWKCEIGDKNSKIYYKLEPLPF